MAKEYDMLQKMLDLAFLDKMANTLIRWACSKGLKVIVSFEIDDPDAIDVVTSDSVDETFLETTGDAILSLMDDYVEDELLIPDADASDSTLDERDMAYITRLIQNNQGIARYN